MKRCQNGLSHGRKCRAWLEWKSTPLLLFKQVAASQKHRIESVTSLILSKKTFPGLRDCNHFEMGYRWREIKITKGLKKKKNIYHMHYRSIHVAFLGFNHGSFAFHGTHKKFF